MGILDEIAKGGNARPIAAFLVGREQRFARERQASQDALNEELARARISNADRAISVQEGTLDFNKGQAAEEKRQAAQIAAEEARLFSVKKADTTKAVLGTNLPNNLKGSLLGQLQAAQTPKDLENVLDEMNQQFQGIQRTQEVPLNAKALNTDAVESANASSALFRNITSTIPEIEGAPGSVGIRGKVGAVAGAATSLALGETAGNQVSRAITGESQEDIAAMQARLSQIRSQLITIVSGEESGRFSEPEREIASRTVSVIDSLSPADIAKGFPQVMGGLKEMAVASLENQYEQAKASEAVNPPFNLDTREGALALLDELEAAGLSVAQRERALKRLSRIQNGN